MFGKYDLNTTVRVRSSASIFYPIHATVCIKDNGSVYIEVNT